MSTKKNTAKRSRREFLKTAGIVSAGMTGMLATAPAVHAVGSDVIRVGLVGCGGRGGGAVVQALNTEGPTKLVALADAFENKARTLLPRLKENFPNDVDPNPFVLGGLDGYKHAIDAVGPGGVILLATAPAFRPLHVEYAVNKGVHVFMEKSFGVDAPGVRRIMNAGKLALVKNLKIVGGLMSRHNVPLQRAIEQLHAGMIGERISCWAYRMHGPVGLGPRRADESVLAHQIRNYSNFTWLNGSFLLDWLIHNLDVCCWAKGTLPVSAQGMGGRQVRTEKDQLFDHYAVEYTFADGTRLFAQGRHQAETWGSFQSTIHGTSGCAVIGEGITHPRIFKGHNPDVAHLLWEYKDSPPKDQYQIEHDVLFDAIRNDKPVNEADRCCEAAMIGILGRMASETGRVVTWDEAMNSTTELAPGLDTLTLDSPAPVMPDENGNYPIAMPGVTKI